MFDMADLPPLFAAGQRLGRYELVRRLAVGGMAEVYLAYAVGPGDFRKVVAIKRLLPQHALDPQVLRMFLDEARLMAGLSHPNVPQVTDVDHGARGDVPYFVMEYIHGTDLRGVLNAAGGPLPIEQALAIAGGVAAGLHHAHEHRGHNGQPLGIVHRDVSPSNILISFDGAVKVTDFGIAKWSEQKSFTHQGQLKGKFAHMSPEQCRGEGLDRRSDVFALGTLLYEMTTGQPPFSAESDYDLLTQIVSRDAPAPASPDGSYPADLAVVVMRSLARRREDRHPTAQHLQLEMEAFARAHRLVVSPVAVAAYMESLFGARVTEWREALATGKSLAEHLERASGSPGGIARDRTATDVFAAPSPAHAQWDQAPTVTDDVGGGDGRSNPVAPTATGTAIASGTAAATAGRERGRRGLVRVVAVGGAVAAGIVAVLFATELTSRWQKVAPIGVSGQRATDRTRSAAPADRRADSPTAVSTLPSPVATASVTTDADTVSVPSDPDPTKETSTRSKTLRGSGVARRQPAGAGVTRTTPGHSSTSDRRPTWAARTDRRGSGQAPPPPSPATEASTEVVPPAAPVVAPPPLSAVKVWDPDSPVPP